MEQTDAILDELTRSGRIAYRRLVRAGASKAGPCLGDGKDPTGQILSIKKQLQVEIRLRRTTPWASRPLRTAALESHLADLLQAQSLRTQQTATGPPPTA